MAQVNTKYFERVCLGCAVFESLVIRWSILSILGKTFLGSKTWFKHWVNLDMHVHVHMDMDMGLNMDMDLERFDSVLPSSLNLTLKSSTKHETRDLAFHVKVACGNRHNTAPNCLQNGLFEWHKKHIASKMISFVCFVKPCNFLPALSAVRCVFLLSVHGSIGLAVRAPSA